MKKRNVTLLDFVIVEDPPGVDSKWLISARFVDLNDHLGYDKMFSIAGFNRMKLVKIAEYRCTVMCSIDDQNDTEAINTAFGQREA